MDPPTFGRTLRPNNSKGFLKNELSYVNRAKTLRLFVGRKSTRADSSRQKVISGFDAVKLSAPDWKFGRGKYVVSSSAAFGSILLPGMMFPGKGWPVSGSVITRSGRSALKSPLRCASVATVAVRVPLLSMIRLHSWDQKKKSFSFIIGPPIVYPKLLYRFSGFSVAKKFR